MADSASGQAPGWPRTAPGERVYAVGDVHGRADLLDAMIALIRDDLTARPPEGIRPWLVMLGDYVDRGPDSRGVLARLVAGPWPVGLRRVFLKGNHEDMMLRLLRGAPGLAGLWLANGGAETLGSYGVAATDTGALPARLDAALPADHRRFLEGLDLLHASGDYLFVHAGIRPGVPLDRQAPEDLMWIREPFLSAAHALGAVVVHGHTIHAAPVEQGNRIGIDTGAYASDVLTCLVLEGATRRYLSTA